GRAGATRPRQDQARSALRPSRPPILGRAREWASVQGVQPGHLDGQRVRGPCAPRLRLHACDLSPPLAPAIGGVPSSGKHRGRRLGVARFARRTSGRGGRPAWLRKSESRSIRRSSGRTLLKRLPLAEPLADYVFEERSVADDGLPEVLCADWPPVRPC